jgi:flagellar basal-body rod protein FlgC
MSLIRAFEIGAQGLSAQRTRMETVASNLANARTTRTPEGGPYRRIAPVFVTEPLAGAFGDKLGRVLRSVRVAAINTDDRPPLRRFEPGHPDADAAGFVAYPNINLVEEMVDMLSATRTYEANVTVVKSVRDLLRTTLDILG